MMIKGKATTEPPRRSALPGVRIRPATATDERALTRLRTQAEKTHAALLPDYFRVPAGERSAPAWGSWSTVLCAVDGDETVRGYVALRVVDTPRDPTVTPCRRAYVETVVVDEPCRGRGVGTALMQAAADWARLRGSVELVLTVWSDNQAAQAMYRRLGYQPIARILRRPLGP